MIQVPPKPTPSPQALTLLEQMREGCVTFDSLWRFTYVNAEAEALLQRSRDELLNRSLVSLFPEVANTPIYKQFRTTLEQDAPIAFTAYYPPLGKWFEIRAHPYGTGLSVSFRDITELRAGETALRQSEGRFRALMEQAGDAFFLHDLEGRILDVNRQACASLRANRQTLLGMTVQQVEQGHPEESIEPLMASLQPGQILTLQGRHQRLDGSSFPVEIRLSRLDLDGKPLFSALVRDVSERQRYEQQLRDALRQAEQSRDQITAILRSVSDALVVTDNQGHILLMNRMAEQLTASACTDVAGLPLDSILPDGALRRELQLARLHANAEIPFEIEQPTGGEASESLILQGRVAPILDARGEQLGHISLLRDVTRERQVDRLKSEFISTAAHELRTPLTSILGFTEILRDLAHGGHFDPRQEREFLNIIHDKAETLAQLIDELLDLGRIESGRDIQLEQQECDLGELLTRIARQHTNRDKLHSYTLELPENPPRLLADARKLTQVFENLLGNAAKYSPPGRSIRVSARCAPDCCTVEVVDSGIGLAPEHLELVFEKFFRVDNSNTAREGLGLGLTIARNITQAHGGQLWLESSLGQGTTAFLQLPCPPHRRIKAPKTHHTHANLPETNVK